MKEEEIVFHSYVDFDFNDNLIMSHSANGYSAAYSDESIILIWKNETSGPNIKEGKVISIIINQFENIDQMHWVYNSDDLLLRDKDKIMIWDIFKNEIKDTYLTTEPVLYSKVISIGLLLVKTNGKFSLITKDREITSQLTSDLILDVEEGVMIFPNVFRVQEGIWTETELSMPLSGRLIRRRFENSNNIQINGDLIQIDEEDPGNLEIPDNYKHIFDDCGLIVIMRLGLYYIFKTRKLLLLTKIVEEGQNVKGVMLQQENQVLMSNIDDSFIARTSLTENKIVEIEGIPIIQGLTNDLVNSNVGLENLPPSIYFDSQQELDFIRYNDKYGLLWFPDAISDYIFYDLFFQTGSLFPDIEHNKHSYVLVDKESTTVLIWNRGKSYPSGKLLKFDIMEPDQKPELLYDVEISTKRISEDEFIDKNLEDVDFPLILPEWNQIQLWAKTDEQHFDHYVSYAQYYLMIDRLSQSENAALLKYPNDIPEKIAFIHFGELEFEIDDRLIRFEDIAPEWSFHPNTGYLAYYTIDQHCYVINTFDEFLLPIYDFESKLPYRIEFSSNGMYLIFISFSIEETEISSHPNDGYASRLKTQFPYMHIEVHNLITKKSKKRSSRFPILLDYSNIEIKEENGCFFIFYPSYSDNSEESVTMFDKTKESFHTVSGTDYYRLWMTHSRNSPFTRFNKGEEFPLIAHPEISRDHEMRPFDIYEGVLVRKEDQLAITMADINLETIHQRSTANIYDLADTEILEVPFYYSNSMKKIYIDKEKLGRLKLKNFYELSPPNEKIHHVAFDLLKIPRNNNIKMRMKSFIDKMMSENTVHNLNGIAYMHPDAEKYSIDLEKIVASKKLV